MGGFLRAKVIYLILEKGKYKVADKKIMLGNEAIARGAYEAGVKVSAAYPGTPSTEISENIVKYPEIYAEWSPNEKVAMEVAIGAHAPRASFPRPNHVTPSPRLYARSRN